MDQQKGFDGSSQPGIERNAAPQSSQAQQQQQQSGTEGFQKNWRMTVCSYWMKGLCMRGDACGFLHKLDQQRMPVCRDYARTGHCADPTCQFKHTDSDVKECNMYRLGFCVYGAHCRYKHSWAEGPPPSPKTAAIKLAELHRHRARRQEMLKRDEERERLREEEQSNQQQQPPHPFAPGWPQQHSSAFVGYGAQAFAGNGNSDGQQQQQQQQLQYAGSGQMRGMISGPRPPPGDPVPQSAPAAAQPGGMQFPSPLIYADSAGAGLPLPFLPQPSTPQLTQ